MSEGGLPLEARSPARLRLTSPPRSRSRSGRGFAARQIDLVQARSLCSLLRSHVERTRVAEWIGWLEATMQASLDEGREEEVDAYISALVRCLRSRSLTRPFDRRPPTVATLGLSSPHAAAETPSPPGARRKSARRRSSGDGSGGGGSNSSVVGRSPKAQAKAPSASRRSKQQPAWGSPTPAPRRRGRDLGPPPPGAEKYMSREYARALAVDARRWGTSRERGQDAAVGTPESFTQSMGTGGRRLGSPGRSGSASRLLLEGSPPPRAGGGGSQRKKRPSKKKKKKPSPRPPVSSKQEKLIQETATWVAVHGEGFESLLRQRNTGNPLWAFLLEPQCAAAARYRECVLGAKQELQASAHAAETKVWTEAETGWIDDQPLERMGMDDVGAGGKVVLPPARPPRSSAGSPQRQAAELQQQLQDALQQMNAAFPPSTAQAPPPLALPPRGAKASPVPPTAGQPGSEGGVTKGEQRQMLSSDQQQLIQRLHDIDAMLSPRSSSVFQKECAVFCFLSTVLPGCILAC
jgi:hypothetical protein